jgi:hypothetical protein
MVVRMRNGPPHRCAPTSATQPASALFASAYLSRTKRPAGTPRPGRGIDGPVGKDVASRVWCKVKDDWTPGTSTRSKPSVRFILGGTVGCVQFDRKATSISFLVSLGVHPDGQKVLLAIGAVGGEGEAAWRALLAT